MVDNLSRAAHALPIIVILICLSADEIALPMYVDWSTNFSCPVDWALKYVDCATAREVRSLPNQGPGYDTKASDIWECEVPLHCHYFQLHSDSEWLYLFGKIGRAYG